MLKIKLKAELHQMKQMLSTLLKNNNKESFEINPKRMYHFDTAAFICKISRREARRVFKPNHEKRPNYVNGQCIIDYLKLRTHE